MQEKPVLVSAALKISDNDRGFSNTRAHELERLLKLLLVGKEKIHIPNMPTDNASVLEHVQAISNITLELTKKGASLSNTRRKELIRNAEGLAIAAREPEENLYFQATQVRVSCE